MLREAIEQSGKTINTFCQFTYFLTFSYILLAYRFCQYVSCIYYIYLYISTRPLFRAPLWAKEWRPGEFSILALSSWVVAKGTPNCPNGPLVF